MRIFVLGTRGIPDLQGGVEKHCEQLYPRISDQGCEVTVFCRTNYFPVQARIKTWNKVRLFYIWSLKNKYLEAFLHTFLGSVISIIKRPDIVHFHNMGPALFLPLVRIFGIRTVFTYHSINYLHQKWGSVAKVILLIGERLGMLLADRIIVVSKATQKFLQGKYRNKSIIYIPNGIELKGNAAASGILQKLDLQTKTYIFTATRFTPEKGVLDLIKAFLLIKNPVFKLVIAGDADHESEYSRQVREYAEKSQNIVLTGLVFGDDLYELYMNASLFVLSSYSEGLPMAILESLSFYLPVLVSDIPQTRDFGFAGSRYYKPGNIEELSKKISELFNVDLTEQEKQKYIDLLKEFDWEAIAKETYQVYQNVLK